MLDEKSHFYLAYIKGETRPLDMRLKHEIATMVHKIEAKPFVTTWTIFWPFSHHLSKGTKFISKKKT